MHQKCECTQDSLTMENEIKNKHFALLGLDTHLSRKLVLHHFDLLQVS